MKPPCRVLTVDDDKDFCRYLKRLLKPFYLLMDFCYSYDEAKVLLEKNKYNGFILDLKLPDGSGFDLIATIRKKLGKDVPICTVSAVYRDAATFRKLKDEYNVNFVMDKPIKPEEARTLLSQFSQICHAQNTESCEEELAYPTDPEYAEAKKKYDSTIPEKIETLEKLIANAKQSPTKNNFILLRDDVHRIEGSAGSYGYSSVSQVCKLMEIILDQLIANYDSIKDITDQMPDFFNFAHQVKSGFQITPTTSHETMQTRPEITGERQAVYIVANDRSFLDMIERNKEKYDIDILTESDPEKALKKIASDSFHPKMIIMNQVFRGATVTSDDLIEALQKKETQLHTILGMLVESNDLTNRMTLMRKGVENIYREPVSVEILLNNIHKTLLSHLLHGFKILVVDSEKEDYQFITRSLQEVGMEVKILPERTPIIDVIVNYKPNCLIIDIKPPDFIGLHLLHTLRSDPRFDELSIVVITGFQDKETFEKAYEFDIDDMFFKPLNKSVLQNRLYHLVKRRVISNSHLEHDHLTGLGTGKALSDQIFQIQKHLDPSQPTPMLALIEIENYNNLAASVGHRIEEVIIKVTNSLLSSWKNALFAATLGNGRFAAIIKPVDISVMQRRAVEVLTKVTQEFSADKESLPRISFNCGITTLPSKFTGIEAVYKSAEEALTMAKTNSNPSNPISIAFHNIDERNADIRKEIFLIDSDKNILDILTAAFEGRGYKINAFTEGKQALEQIVTGHADQLPDLIILERHLDDMDGIEILKAAKRRLAFPPPFIFLSLYSSEKDVAEGLEAGAQDYISKPFSLGVLMQKTHTILS